jgi:hypothetical protein
LLPLASCDESIGACSFPSPISLLGSAAAAGPEPAQRVRERRGVARVAASAGRARSASAAAEVAACRSCGVGDARPAAAAAPAPRLDGEAADAAALAPGARAPQLDAARGALRAVRLSTVEVRELVVRLAREKPALGLPADRPRAAQARAACLAEHGEAHSVSPTVLGPPRDAQAKAGASSCASKPRACSPVTSSRSRRSRCAASTCSSSSNSRPAASTWRAAPPTRPGAWVSQQARNLNFTGLFERMRFLIHDRDSKFGGAFDEVFLSEGITVIHTAGPCTASERLRRARRPHRPGRMSRLATDHRPPPPRVRTPLYTAHYNREPPHRGLALLTPNSTNADPHTSRGENQSPRPTRRTDPRIPPSRSMNQDSGTRQASPSFAARSASRLSSLTS